MAANNDSVGLDKIIEPITSRLQARNIRAATGDSGVKRVTFDVPVHSGTVETGEQLPTNKVLAYTLTEEDGIITYRRSDSPNKEGKLNVSEIRRVYHYLAPLMRLISAAEDKYPEIRADDIMVRLHLLLPGDKCLAISRIVYIGVGAQKSYDIYRVR